MKEVGTNTKAAVIVIAITLASLFVLPAARAEVVDRIIATVNGHAILESDWDDALRFEAFLNGKRLSDFTEDDRRTVLDRLIDQELLAEQMNSALFQHASESEAAARIAETRKQYPEAATPEGWQALLSKFQLTEKDLLTHVEQQIDLMRLVDAHLRPAVQIDYKTIEAYYRDQFVPQLRQSGGNEVPLSDVSGKIRELLTEQKVNELLVSWLQTLRSEGKVIIAGVTEPAGGGVQSQ